MFFLSDTLFAFRFKEYSWAFAWAQRSNFSGIRIYWLLQWLSLITPFGEPATFLFRLGSLDLFEHKNQNSTFMQCLWIKTKCSIFIIIISTHIWRWYRWIYWPRRISYSIRDCRGYSLSRSWKCGVNCVNQKCELFNIFEWIGTTWLHSFAMMCNLILVREWFFHVLDLLLLLNRL